MKHILITGSEGFIGTHLVNKINKMPNFFITTCDRKSGQEVEDFIPLIYKFDVVIHLAAQTSVFNTNIEQIKKDNIDSFIKLALECEKHNVKLIYASSSTAHNTTSMYGLSKKFDEDFAKIYASSATGLRFHNVYSSNPREKTLLWCLLNQKETILYNNGENIRCFTYIDDVIDAILYAIDSKEQLMNVVNAEPMKISDFANIISKYTNCKYTLCSDKRKYDNIAQLIDEDIPLVPIKYHKVEEVCKNIF